MSNLTDIKRLLDCVIKKKVPIEFANMNVDYEAALRDEVKKLIGDGKNRSLYEKNKWDLFEVISQSIADVVPNKVSPAIATFADVVRIPEDGSMEFRVTKGKQRAKQYVTRATESGVYETFRLDRDTFKIDTVTYAGAGIVDFVRYLTGVENMMDVYEILSEAFTDIVYREIQGALMASWNASNRPAANKVYMNTFDANAMQKLINTVSGYSTGRPVIYTSPEFASTMSNAITYSTSTTTTNTRYPDEDLSEIRNQGYIGVFRGSPVIVMPQSFVDEQNTQEVFNPRFAYVLPTGKEKPIKVVFRGNPYIDEWKNHDRSTEIGGWMNIGVGLVTAPNYWGIAYNTGIAAGGWDNSNINP